MWIKQSRTTDERYDHDKSYACYEILLVLPTDNSRQQKTRQVNVILWSIILTKMADWADSYKSFQEFWDFELLFMPHLRYPPLTKERSLYIKL